MAVKRLPAKKVRISDVFTGRYFPGSKEDMSPSYIITSMGQKISRANLIATVTDKFVSEDENYSSINIDDGTAAVRVKTFKDNIKLFEGFEIGDLVVVIGKLKEYMGEIYINGEIVRKVEPNYENLRKLEILNDLIEQKKIVEEIRKMKDQLTQEQLIAYVKKFNMEKESLEVALDNLRVIKEIDYKPKILELINTLDDGEGVEISKILAMSELPENVIEQAINELLSSGNLYEPRPGILKVVISSEENSF